MAPTCCKMEGGLPQLVCGVHGLDLGSVVSVVNNDTLSPHDAGGRLECSGERAAGEDRPHAVVVARSGSVQQVPGVGDFGW